MDYFDDRDQDLTPVSDCSEERIQKSFEGKNIFITGCSGFVGKVLLEKLLRSCPVAKIYLLFRTKKNVPPQERIVNLLKEDIFEKVRLMLGEKLFSKIVVIPGDCCLPKLGISDEDMETICSNTNYVFHVAAALKMNDTVRGAYISNVQGTDEALKIACRMPHLKSFIYVSTAYSHPRFDIDEQFYDVNYKSEELVKILSKVPDEILEVLGQKVLYEYPNTYAMTKGMAEDVVKSYKDRLPLAIVRPSIVVGCAEEPLVGWVGSVNGATGVLFAASIGVMRVWGGHHSLNVDMVPADFLINMTIVAAWKTAQSKRAIMNSKDPIYNYVCTPKAPTTWGQYMSLNERAFWKDNLITKETRFPYEFRLQPSWTLYRIQIILFHLLPGLLMDGLLKLLGKRPQLVKVYKKFHILNTKLYFYCMNDWDFKQNNVDQLWSDMTLKEKNIFPFDMTGFLWEDYFETCPRGMKVYLLKDPMSDKRRQKQLNKVGQTYYAARWLLKRYAIYVTVKYLFYYSKNVISWFFIYNFCN